jgi:PAS domain S-box-containing protein
VNNQGVTDINPHQFLPADLYLGNSPQFLRSIINQMKDLVFVKDSHHRFVLVNDAFCNFLGCTDTDLIGTSDRDLFPREQSNILWMNDELVFSTNVPHQYYGYLKNQRTKNHIFSVCKSLVADEAGNQYLLGIMQDVTYTQKITAELQTTNDKLAASVKECNEALLDRQVQLQRLTDNMPGMIYQLRLEPDGTVSFPFISSGCRDIYQLEPEDIQKNPAMLFSTVHPEDNPNLGQAFFNSAQSLEIWESEYRISTNSNQQKWVKAIARPITQPDNSTIWYGCLIDISEQKKVEEELQKQTNILQWLFDSMSDGVLVADEQGQFIVSNPAVEKMFGKAAPDNTDTSGEWQEQYGLFLSDTKTPFPEDQLPILHTLQGKSVDNVEMFIRNVNSPEGIWVIISGRPLKDAHNNFKGGVIVCRDVTERKQAEAKLKLQAQKLKNALMELKRTQAQMLQNEKMSSLGQLVAGIAHEINNPVNFIHANLTHADEYTQDLLELLQLYQQHYPDSVTEIQDLIAAIDLDFVQEDLPRLLSSMKVGTQRISEIVLSLRNFSRLDEAEMKEVNLHEGIDKTLMLLQHRLSENNQRREIQVIKNYSNLPDVDCYAGQLNQVFMNIIINAIDALEESIAENPDFTPQITIRTEVVAGNYVEIGITDNGPGIPEKMQKRIFDPFFTTKSVGKGTGMGLSISYKIVTEQHSGSLQCVSQFGKGTEFVISIPLRQNEKIKT